MFKAIASSSAANHYLYGVEGTILAVDCGVTAKTIDTSIIDAVVITHGHGDHINPPAIRKILKAGIPVYAYKAYKRVRKETVFAKLDKESRDAINYIDINELVEIDTLFGKIRFKMMDLVPHDVPNVALDIEIELDDEPLWTAFHVTDCGDIEHIKFIKFYDHMTIESNYCESKLQHLIDSDHERNRKANIKKKIPKGQFVVNYSRFERSITTHHSVQQCFTAYKRRIIEKGRKTTLFEAHKSAQAYSKAAYKAAEKRRLERDRKKNGKI